MVKKIYQKPGMNVHLARNQFIHTLERLSTVKGLTMSEEVREIMMVTTGTMTAEDLHYYAMMYDRETRTLLAEQARVATESMLWEMQGYPRYSAHRSQMSSCGTYYM
jgi:hypothetical protein